ncbi:MAG: alpha/beta fold hydrolase [Gemmatimonadota bacterium]|nr:alpha/beta fold hydrolase [Gemmatimonadota bacterium]
MRRYRSALHRSRFALATAALMASASPLRAQGPAGAPDQFVGTWKGVLELPGVHLRLALDVSRSGDALGGSLTSLDQDNTRIPVTLVVRNDSLVAEMPSIVASFVVSAAGGDSLRGAFHQNGAVGRIAFGHLSHTIVPLVARRPQEPVGPLPYNSVDVSFPSVSGVVLAGTLTSPVGAGPWPAVVLVSGSGPQDRDERMLGHRPFLVLSDYLTRHGIAVLRYDDRGAARSTGSFATSTTADFADDAEHAVRFLAERLEVDRTRIGIIGHSEGGVIAPIVAARSKDVAFIVLMAGPGVTGDSLLILQNRAQWRLAGVPDVDVEPLARLTSRLLHAVSGTRDSGEARAHVLAIEEQYVAEQRPERQEALRTNLLGRNAQLLSPWMQYFLAFDPRSALSRVRVPVLALNGTLDGQVLYKENLSAIRAALTTAGNGDFETVELPGLNHLFQTARTGATTEYSVIEETIAPAALDRLGDWLTRHTRPR